LEFEQEALSMNLFRQPLLRLLAINLAIGASVALLMVGGLAWLNPFGLRDLILADRSPATALGLLLFGFVITFGSAAMGSAIMTLVRSDGRGGNAPSAAAPLAVARAIKRSPPR
jgi:membrane associated rhomboid family serine protease